MTAGYEVLIGDRPRRWTHKAVKDALREVAKENSKPSRQTPRRGHAEKTLGMSERLACSRLGWPAPPTGASQSGRHRPTRTLIYVPGCAATPPNTTATGFRRAWTPLRHDEHQGVNKKAPRCAVPAPRLVHRVDHHYPLEVGLAGRRQLDLACAPQEEGDGELALGSLNRCDGGGYAMCSRSP